MRLASRWRTRSGVRRRRSAALAGGLLAALGLLAAGCGQGGSTPAAGSAPSSGQHSRAVETPSPSPSPSPPPPPQLPRGGRQLFPAFRVVAFYGSAGDPALGVLGQGSPDEVWPKLAAQAAPYATATTPVLPAYELITYVASAAAGSDGDYATRIADSTIDAYLAAVRRHHALLILDIQPGRGDFLADAQSLGRWLDQPDVALALDPEWQLQPDQLPLHQIGHTDAAKINQVSAWLAALTTSKNLPQKLLLIHQFTADMVQDKPAVEPRPQLAMTFNMDGFGSRMDKLSKYQLLASDPRFALGIKLFYRQDVDIFAPSEALALRPPPSIIDYQ